MVLMLMVSLQTENFFLWMWFTSLEWTQRLNGFSDMDV